MITFTVRATDGGRTVNHERFQAGELVDEDWYSLCLTTSLTDVVTDALEYCRELDRGYTFRCLQPDTEENPTFVIEIYGRGFTIRCRRELARGAQSMSPFSAEDGSRYDVVFTIEADDLDLEDEIAMELQSRYPLV